MPLAEWREWRRDAVQDVVFVLERGISPLDAGFEIMDVVGQIEA